MRRGSGCDWVPAKGLSLVWARKADANYLNKLRLSWHGHWGDGEFHVPGEMLGGEFLLRIEGLFPCDFLACIRSHAAHDAEERAVAHVFAVIDRFPFAD